MIRCLAVDDEPLALSVIKTFCSKVPFLELVSCATNGIEAIEMIKNEEFDLVFIDINMPHLTGIEVVKLLDDPPLIIFTTAYQNYAITGFELSAIDYLVKPFSFDRFFKAVTKAQTQLNLLSNAAQNRSETIIDNYIMIKADNSVMKVELTEILYVEGLKDYVKFLCLDKNIVTKSTMRNIEDNLTNRGFMRVHKSYIINLEKIDSFENNQISISDKLVPLGNQYREQFIQYIEKNKI